MDSMHVHALRFPFGSLAMHFVILSSLTDHLWTGSCRLYPHCPVAGWLDQREGQASAPHINKRYGIASFIPKYIYDQIPNCRDGIWSMPLHLEKFPPQKKKRSTPQNPHSFFREPFPTHFGEKKNTHSLPIRSPLSESCLTGTFASDVTLCCLENRKIQGKLMGVLSNLLHLCNAWTNVLWL